MICLSVLLVACGDSPPENPSLALGAGGFSLNLPPAMQEALTAAAPGFKPVSVASFRSDVSQSAAEGGGIPSLFAVIGDFDGDGTLDAVVEGAVSGDQSLPVFAVLNKKDKPVAMEVTTFPSYDADAVGIYLSKATGTGAFMVVNYPDASTTYAFSGGKFVKQ